jgi:hypothetical protein
LLEVGRTICHGGRAYPLPASKAPAYGNGGPEARGKERERRGAAVRDDGDPPQIVRTAIALGRGVSDEADPRQHDDGDAEVLLALEASMLRAARRLLR